MQFDHVTRVQMKQSQEFFEEALFAFKTLEHGVIVAIIGPAGRVLPERFLLYSLHETALALEFEKLALLVQLDQRFLLG